jgi:hypothetical protein
MPFFIHEAHGPARQGGGVQSRRTRVDTRGLLSRKARCKFMGHVVVPEPTLAGRRGPEPLDMWQHQSPPRLGSGVRSRKAHGSVGAQLNREAGSRAVRHVAAPESISTGGRV